MAGKRTIEIAGETTYTYEQFVLEALNRINALSGSENNSYNIMAHESCINDLWCSIPMAKKLVEDFEGVSFMERWNSVAEKFKTSMSTPPEDRDNIDRDRILGKRQVLTECLNAMGVLFGRGDPIYGALWARGGDE